jgi:hypothetical protein
LSYKWRGLYVILLYLYQVSTYSVRHFSCSPFSSHLTTDAVLRNNDSVWNKYRKRRRWRVVIWSPVLGSTWRDWRKWSHSSRLSVVLNCIFFPFTSFKLQTYQADTIKFCLRFLVFVALLLSSFWLNTEQDVRLNLCCTVLLCHVLLMYEIAHITNGDNTPLLGTYNETILMSLFREGANLLY